MRSRKANMGDVVRFDLGDGLYAFGRHYSDSMRIYRSSGEDRPPIGVRDFVLWVASAGAKPGSAQLPIVAYDPLGPEEEPEPPKWTMDTWGKPRLMTGGELRSASEHDLRTHQRIIGGTWSEAVAAIREVLGFSPTTALRADEAPLQPVSAMDLLRMPMEPGEVTIEIRLNDDMPSDSDLRLRDALEAHFDSRDEEEVDDVGAGGGVMIVHLVTSDLRRTSSEAFRMASSLGLLPRTRIFAIETE